MRGPGPFKDRCKAFPRLGGGQMAQPRVGKGRVCRLGPAEGRLNMAIVGRIDHGLCLAKYEPVRAVGMRSMNGCRHLELASAEGHPPSGFLRQTGWFLALSLVDRRKGPGFGPVRLRLAHFAVTSFLTFGHGGSYLLVR